MSYTLITGASSGIGYEFAKIFAQKGNNLILVARTTSRLEEIKKELETEYGIDIKLIAADLSRAEAASEIYKCTEDIEVENLINNAGFGDCSAFLSSDINRQRDMIAVNVTSLMNLTYLYGNEMKKRGKGRILNVASIAAACAGPYMSVYYASKSCVLSFSQAIAEELNGTGVTVTAICPGPVDTGFEKAANLENSKMFTYFKPAEAYDVAMHGYNAMMKGRVVVFHGTVMKLVNGVVKVVPRILQRKVTRKINKARDKKDF